MSTLNKACNIKKNGSVEFTDNSFDYIRLISALFIVLGHASVYLSCMLPSALAFIQARWIGLYCLFTISGYLVAASCDRSQNSRDYLVKRCIRLYPGLYMALAVSVLSIIIFGNILCGEQYGMRSYVLYIVAQISFFQFYTPGSLKQYATGNPNGSLWTMSLELQMYVLILLLWKRLKKQRTYVWIILILFGAICNVAYPYLESVLPTIVFKLLGVTVFPYAFVFLIGMFAYAKREWFVPVLKRGFPYLLASYIVWCLLNSFIFRIRIGHYADIVSGLLLPLCTIGGAYWAGKHKLKHDLSYGIYLYHMIFVNIFVSLNIKGNYLAFISVFVFSIIMSYISCRYVEEPFNRYLKNKLC